MIWCTASSKLMTPELADSFVQQVGAEREGIDLLYVCAGIGSADNDTIVEAELCAVFIKFPTCNSSGGHESGFHTIGYRNIKKGVDRLFALLASDLCNVLSDKWLVSAESPSARP